MNAFVLTSLYLLAAFVGLKAGGTLLSRRVPAAVILVLFGSILALDGARWIVTNSLLEQQRDLATTIATKGSTYAPALLQRIDLAGAYLALLAVGMFTIAQALKNERSKKDGSQRREGSGSSSRSGTRAQPHPLLLVVTVLLIAGYYLSVERYWTMTARHFPGWAVTLRNLDHAAGADRQNALTWASDVAVGARWAACLLAVGAMLLLAGWVVSAINRRQGQDRSLLRFTLTIPGYALTVGVLCVSLVVHLKHFF